MLPAFCACPLPPANAAVARTPASAASATVPMTRDFIVFSSLRWTSACRCSRGDFLLLPPTRTVRKCELGQRLRSDLDAVARRRRREIATSCDTDRVDEMFVQVVDELAHAVVEGGAYGDVVEHRHVLRVLAEADAAGVRTDRHAELRGEQDDREHLVHAAEPAAVELADVDRSGLQQLLEDDAVLHVLARGDPHRCDSVADALVAEN